METEQMLGRKVIDRNTLSIGVVEAENNDIGYVYVRYNKNDKVHPVALQGLVVIGTVFKSA